MNEEESQDSSKKEIAKRQVFLVLSASLSIGFFMALVQACADYREQKAGIERQIHQLLYSASASASESIWNLDRGLADSVAKGVLSHPMVCQVKIKTSNGVLMSEQKVDHNIEPGWSDSFTFLFGDKRTKQVQLSYPGDKTEGYVGTLSIDFDPIYVRKEFSNRVLILLISGIAKSLALGFVLFALFYFTLTRPIEVYARWISSIDPKNPTSWNTTPPKRKQNDELKLLGSETASRLEQAASYFLELREKRKDLAELNLQLEEKVRERTEDLEKSLTQLALLARTDDLTGLGNRRSFMEQAHIRHTEWQRYKHPYALVMLDIDHFKKINDQHGHDAGDKVLVAVANILSGFTRKENIVGRIGGEEFCILMQGLNRSEAEQMTERIRQAIQSASISIGEGTVDTTASFGVLPPDCLRESFDEGLKIADTMLYEAKRLGRNQVCVFSESEYGVGY